MRRPLPAADDLVGIGGRAAVQRRRCAGAAGARALDALAQAHGVGAATAAYAWILCHPARPLPITGSSRIQAVAAAMAALSLRLTAEDWYRVWSASTGHEVA